MHPFASYQRVYKDPNWPLVVVVEENNVPIAAM